eukprot:2557283-Pyramimonas_sp.AAC.1
MSLTHTHVHEHAHQNHNTMRTHVHKNNIKYGNRTLTLSSSLADARPVFRLLDAFSNPHIQTALSCSLCVDARVSVQSVYMLRHLTPSLIIDTLSKAQWVQCTHHIGAGVGPEGEDLLLRILVAIIYVSNNTDGGYTQPSVGTSISLCNSVMRMSETPNSQKRAFRDCATIHCEIQSIVFLPLLYIATWGKDAPLAEKNLMVTDMQRCYGSFFIYRRFAHIDFVMLSAAICKHLTLSLHATSSRASREHRACSGGSHFEGTIGSSRTLYIHSMQLCYLGIVVLDTPTVRSTRFNTVT